MTIQHNGTDVCRPRAFALTVLFVMIAILTGCAKKTGPLKCIDGDDSCGTACNYSHPCPSGLYCSEEQLCAKACFEDYGCSATRHCNDKGQCVAGAAAPKPQVPKQSNKLAKNQVGGGQSGSNSFVIDAGTRKLDNSDMETCQAADVAAARVIPNVMLVIDQSGSMTQGFGDAGTRWDVLRDFLLRPDGLIAMFENQVKFGLAMYTALEEGPRGTAPPPCPMVTSVVPRLMNYSDISMAYREAGPLGETPTGDAIDAIVDSLPMAQLDQNEGPTVLILATDGEPDRCEQLNPQQGQAEAIAAVMRAFSMGIRTFIISVGDEVSEQHQQDVANAGLGRPMTDKTQYWQAGDDASLRQALTDIIGAQVSCDVTLQGSVQSGDPCLGTVELNSQKLGCKDKDGWELIDPKHIRLLGKACSDFKTVSNAQVHARFPCDVQIVF
jgi:Mg-chelatase subunit ChlD